MSLSDVKSMKENLWNQDIHNWIQQPTEGKIKFENILIFMALLDCLLVLSMGSDQHLFPGVTVCILVTLVMEKYQEELCKSTGSSDSYESWDLPVWTE